MELNDLIFLGACSIFSSVQGPVSRQTAINRSVRVAKEIWEETLKQDRETPDEDSIQNGG